MFNLQTIEKILFKADLEGLIKMGAPSDEYDNEAETIYNRIENARCMEDILIVLCGVFAESFGFGTCYQRNHPYRFKYEVPQSCMHKWERAAQRIWDSRK